MKTTWSQEGPEFSARGNSRRIHIKFKTPVYLTHNGTVTHIDEEAAEMTADGPRSIQSGQLFGHKTAISTRGTLYHHIANRFIRVYEMALIVGRGVVLKVGHDHKLSERVHNSSGEIFPYSPLQAGSTFKLSFYDDEARRGRNLGLATDYEFMLGHRQRWVRNPLEAKALFHLRNGMKLFHELVITWGQAVGLCKDRPHYAYMSQPVKFNLALGSSTTSAATATAISSPTIDSRYGAILEQIFNSGLYKLLNEGKEEAYVGIPSDAAMTMMFHQVSWPARRKILRNTTVRGICEGYLQAKLPKTIIKAIAQNPNFFIATTIASTTISGTGNNAYLISQGEDRWTVPEAKVGSFAVDMLGNLRLMLKKPDMPMEYIVKMIPFMNSDTFTGLEGRHELCGAVEYFGIKRSVAWLERFAEARATGGMTGASYLIDAYRMMCEVPFLMSNASPKQLRMFPKGIQVGRYYKDVKELHDKISMDITRFKAYARSKRIKWLSQWHKMHGLRFGNLRMLVPRSTGIIVRWGQKQKHCIANYSERMLPSDERDHQYITYNGSENRCLLVGIYEGNKLLYNARFEPSTQVYADTEHHKLGEYVMYLAEIRGFNNGDPDPEHLKSFHAAIQELGIQTGGLPYRYNNLNVQGVAFAVNENGDVIA